MTAESKIHWLKKAFRTKYDKFRIDINRHIDEAGDRDARDIFQDAAPRIFEKADI